VRAFRARQRGEDEPPTIDEVIDEGGEVAALWTQLDALRRTVAEQSKTISALESEIATLEQRLLDERDRYAWIDRENERLRSELSRRPKRRSDAPSAATDRSQPAPNRAARRRSQRERRQ
jgi:predicted RNase H-like nuclease (RuvC/YqgF family)